MPDLIFYGASDDLMEVEGVVSEEYPGDRGTFLVVSNGAQVKVRLCYEDNGCWSVCAWPVDEGVDGPLGALTFEGYTAKLHLEVAGTATVHMLAEDREDG